MNTRFQKIILGLLVVSCVCLTGLLLQAHTKGETLQGAIDAAKITDDEAIRSSVEENSRITALNAEISERQQALGNTPEAQETKRRAATLVVINQLKLAHEKNPPAARQKPPPTPASGGLLFSPELLSDPEYNQLFAQQNRRRIARSEGARLHSLGLSEEVIDKVVTALTENYMAFIDYRAVSGKSGIPGDFSKQQNALMDRQLLELMGEETFKRWQKLNEPPESQVVVVPNPTGTGGRSYAMQSHESLVRDAKSYLTSKLGTRLSYTDTPLQNEQGEKLAEILANHASTPGNPVYKALYNEAFIAQSAAVLSPPQVEALRQFKAEQDASVKRSKLPKSSELPRNTLPAK